MARNQLSFWRKLIQNVQQSVVYSILHSLQALFSLLKRNLSHLPLEKTKKAFLKPSLPHILRLQNQSTHRELKTDCKENAKYKHFESREFAAGNETVSLIAPKVLKALLVKYSANPKLQPRAPWFLCITFLSKSLQKLVVV